jgi:AcrR family transcriptional regulator
MPKIIDGIRQNIIISARGILLACGYRGLTIRAVASECGIATGTVYNYFSNKENLAACVMLDDWLAALGRMRDGCDRAAVFAPNTARCGKNTLPMRRSDAATPSGTGCLYFSSRR